MTFPSDATAAEVAGLERIQDVGSAHSIFSLLRDADDLSAHTRAKLDGMFDGRPPYDAKVLLSTGQGSRTNLNFGEAQRYLDISMSAFVDLYDSLDTLVRVKLNDRIDDSMKPEVADIVEEELTSLFREWPEFHSRYLMLCNEFTKHGVSVASFDDAKDWKFRPSGLRDFWIPRQTPASEECIEVACSRRKYLLHELYKFIRDEEVATKMGWNVPEVKRVLASKAKNSDTSSTTPSQDWELVQNQIKNNDIFTGMENTSVEVVRMWAREFTGEVSFYMFAEDSPEKFLCKKPKLFSRPEEAYILFSYGVGTNGTYHSVRGLGQRIFNHIQLSNRMRSQTVDSAMLAGSVMLQPESQKALEDLAFQTYGPFTILSSNVKVVEKASPNLSSAMKPALDDIQSQLAMNVDLMSTYGNQSSPYRNQLQTEHDLAVSSRLTGSTLNLFYSSWSRLLREMVRRVITNPTYDARTSEFVRRCAARGVSKEMLKSVELEKTSAVRAIGAGSAANRLLSLRELQANSGGFDDVGRRNLTRDITAQRVGRDMVDRYAPPKPEPRMTVDAKIAWQENTDMEQGRQVPVFSEELHTMHLRQHVPKLQELIDLADNGQADPVQLLPAYQAFYQHISAHVEFVANDPAAAGSIPQVRQLLQFAEEKIVNATRAAQKLQREQMEQQAAMGGQQQAPSSEQIAAQQKAEMHQLQMQITQQKAQVDMSIKQAKAQQDMALKDAERAMEMEGTIQE